MKLRVPTIYNDRDTVVHRRDPRAKILVFVALVVLLYVAPTWEWMVALSVVGLGLAVLARVPPTWLGVLYLLQLPNVVSMMLLPAAGQFLSGDFTIRMTPQIEAGLKLAFAWSAALFTSIAVFSTMRIEEMTDGFRGLGAPEIFCFAWGYTLTLLYLTVNDMIRVADAMKLKGLNLETRNPLKLAWNLPRMMIPVIFTVVRRANTMMAVLQMRGYSFTERPEREPRSSFGAGDAVLVAMGFGVLGLALADRLGFVAFPLLR